VCQWVWHMHGASARVVTLAAAGLLHLAAHGALGLVAPAPARGFVRPRVHAQRVRARARGRLGRCEGTRRKVAATMNAAATTGLGAAAVLAAVGSGAVVWLLNVLHSDVGVEAPTARQLAEEDHERHALFRHLPALRGRLAWRGLGVFPTPVHRATCSAAPISSSSGASADPRAVSFFVKREDLSSAAYGGNKVRTLQHQLGI